MGNRKISLPCNRVTFSTRVCEVDVNETFDEIWQWANDCCLSFIGAYNVTGFSDPWEIYEYTFTEESDKLAFLLKFQKE